MSNFSLPIAVDLAEAGQIQVSYEDVNGTGAVQIRWIQDGEYYMAAPHYDTVLRLIEVLLWATMAARKEEMTGWSKALDAPSQRGLFIQDDGTMEYTDPSVPLRFKVGDRVKMAIGGQIMEGWWEITPTGMKSVEGPES